MATRRYEEHAAVGIAAALAGVGLGAVAVYQGSAARLKRLAATRTWIANSTTVQALMSVPGASAAVEDRFNQAEALVAITAQPVTPALELAPAAQVAIIFDDETNLAAAVTGGTLNRAITTVIYDYEHWSKTPAAQQQNSAAYVEAAAYACHSAGLKLIAAPSPDLVNALGVTSTDALTQWQAFFDLGLAAAAARYADGVVVQAQGVEGDPAHYLSIVRTFARQARLANPYVKIYVVLSGAPSGQAVPSEQLYSLMLSVADTVDGYWLYVPLRVAAPASGEALTASQSVQEDAQVQLVALLGSV